MRDPEAATRPTARPPSQARSVRSPHPNDVERECRHCGVTQHYYEGAQIQARGTAHVWEVWLFTCAECRSTFDVLRTVRLDLDGEAHGMVIDRREPQPAADVAAIVALLRGVA